MMWYWIVLIAVSAAAVPAAAALACVLSKKKKTKLVPAQNGELSFREVPAEEIDEACLCEIDDPTVADRVKALMPEAVRAEVSAGLIVTKCSKTVYKVILPASTKLAAGTSGGLLASSGAPMAAAQVGSLAVSSFSAVMSAASMVVGQYYMTLVNRQLKLISETLSKLGDFQDNEFKSKVFALHAQVMRSSVFRGETMADAGMREAELDKLNRMEHECIELLGQAALMIANYTARTDLDYQKYIRAAAEVEKWYASQKILLATLREIADLRFALHLGAASREQCTALLPLYTKQAEETQRALLAWHTFTAEKLGLRLEESRRKRRGLDRAIHWLPGLFKKDLKYREMPASTVALIENQIAGDLPAQTETGDLFRDDVEIIAKDGKLYYLPHERPREASSDCGPTPPSHEPSDGTEQGDVRPEADAS